MREEGFANGIKLGMTHVNLEAQRENESAMRLRLREDHEKT
jgi:hypothetical protein